MPINTFTDMAARIADELNRTDLTAQISLAIANSIFHYQGERFWFNEDRSKTFSLSSSQEFYTSTDFANMEQILKIDDIAIVPTAGSPRIRLIPRSWDWFDEYSISPSSVGVPSAYCYYQQRLRFYPIPNGGYLVRVAGIYKLQNDASITASLSTAWFNEAEELIRVRAKCDLYENLLFDNDKADRMKNRENDELGRLRQETSNRLGLSYTRARAWRRDPTG